MARATSLQLISTSEQRKVAERLWQLYVHDLSEFRGHMPGSSGQYETARLLNYFGDPNRRGYLLYSDQAPGGFALIHGLAGETRVMGDFFVVRAARRQRVGHDAAVKVMNLHPGRWAIPFQEENPGAARFWRLVGAELATADCKEERRPVPGKPAEPPDIWLLLNTTT
jgi:predicted acetyltransferase